MRAVTEKRKSFPDRLDYLFVAAGSDFRAYEVLRKVAKSGADVDRIVLVHFAQRQVGNTPAEQQAYDSYKSLGFKNVQDVAADIRDASDFLRSLDSSGVKLDSSSRVGLDISCFTKPYFFTLLKYFLARHDIASVEVFYTEPESYIFDTGLYDSFRSSTGPITISEIPSFTGRFADEASRMLVLLLGFDGDLAREITIDTSPKRTVLVNGFPGYAAKFKDISLVNNEKLVQVSGDNDLQYSRSSNPFEVYNLLDALKASDPEQLHVHVAPLGTKPMALGACLFAIHHPDVRIVYPLPEVYEKRTTENCAQSWAYLIPLKRAV